MRNFLSYRRWWLICLLALLSLRVYAQEAPLVIHMLRLHTEALLLSR